MEWPCFIFNMNQQIITNNTSNLSNHIRNVWRRKHLIGMFLIRDFKIKYTQTKLKVFWLLFQPLLMMTVFTFFFGYLLGWHAGQLPFPVYVLSGLIIWNLFQSTIQSSTYVLIENSTLVKNNNFPKIILTISKTIGVIIDSFISIIILCAMMFFYGIIPSWHFVFFVIPILLVSVLSLSCILLIQSYTYKKRDVLFALPSFLSLIIWITPVFFTSQLIPHKISYFLYFNPVASLVELWRYCIFPDADFDLNYFPVLLFIIPLFYFSLVVYVRNEVKFNDYL